MAGENAYSQNVRNKLARNVGHLAKVKEMMDDGDDFERVMMQLSAVRHSIETTANAIVAERAQSELILAFKNEDPEKIHKFYKDYSKYF